MHISQKTAAALIAASRAALPALRESFAAVGHDMQSPYGEAVKETANALQAVDDEPRAAECLEAWPDDMPRPEFGQSLQWIDATARAVEWSDMLGEGGDGWRVILPPVTLAFIHEQDPDGLREWLEDEGVDVASDADLPAIARAVAEYAGDDPAAADPDNPDDLPDDLRERFESSRAGDEWSEGFAPVMSYVWPVSIAYGGPDAETVARLVDKYAGAVSLVEFSDDAKAALWGEGSDSPDYGLALTGGGMDLSDCLAAAYICAGCVPPRRLLDSAARLGDHSRVAGPLRPAFHAAYAKAVATLAFRADDMARTMAQAFPVDVEGGAA